MKLSKHFSLEEMTRSEYAASHNINNTMPYDVLLNMLQLVVNVLEPLREAWGAPIIVTSGYRCPEVNKGVGGVATSQHMKGMAADIRPKSMKDIRELFKLANSMCNYDQLLYEINKSDGTVRCIHISCNSDPSKNRHYCNDKYYL